MPRIPFFMAGRLTPVLDHRNTDTPFPAQQPTTAQSNYHSLTLNRSITPGTIILDTPPGSPRPFAPRIKVRDFAYVSRGKLTPARPPRPDNPLFNTDEERTRLEQKMGLQVEFDGLKRSHSRSTSCPTSTLPTKNMPRTNARSRASSHPLLADIPSTPPPVATEPAPTAPTTPPTMPKALYRTPEGKKRPTALKLHSSNLAPSKALPITPTPIRIARTRVVLVTAKRQPEEDHEEIVESVGHGEDDNVFYTPIRSGSVDDLSSIPFKLDRRISRSASDLRYIGGPCHSGMIFEQPHVSTPMPPRRTPVKAITDIFCSEPESSVSPPSTTPCASRSFENIPLPWSLVPSASLDAEQINTYLTLPDSSMPSPCLLPPKMLSTCLSESSRLKAELGRLRTKYAKLLSQRDYSMRELQTSIRRNDLESLAELGQKVERQLARCDRVARQMYVCNDQIRQIEGQMVEHRVGVWQLRNRKVQEEEQSNGVEILTDHRRSADLHGSRPYLQVRGHLQDRSSKISFGNLDDLAFPLPPTRTEVDLSQDPHHPRMLLPTPVFPLAECTLLKVGTQCREDEHLIHPPDTEVDHDDQDHEDGQPTQTHETSGTDCPLSPNAILIYPPNHYRSASVPLLSVPDSMDLPHTPYIGDRPGSSEWDGEDTRRAIPGRTRGTPPLRFAVKSKAGKGRWQSMILARDARAEQKAQKRESELNTPDSILLSLATAQMWTRDM